MVANFGAFAVGNCIVMPSVILEKLKETDDDIKLTTEEGSWFGKRFNKKIFCTFELVMKKYYSLK